MMGRAFNTHKISLIVIYCILITQLDSVARAAAVGCAHCLTLPPDAPRAAKSRTCLPNGA